MQNVLYVVSMDLPLLKYRPCHLLVESLQCYFSDSTWVILGPKLIFECGLVKFVPAVARLVGPDLLGYCLSNTVIPLWPEGSLSVCKQLNPLAIIPAHTTHTELWICSNYWNSILLAAKDNLAMCTTEFLVMLQIYNSLFWPICRGVIPIRLNYL